ncbi:MAG: transglutaminase family protein [Sandaracinaceae bacterium]
MRHARPISTTPKDDADRDSFIGAALRKSRHPLRMFAMATAVYGLIANVALTTGIVAAVTGAIVGVVLGEVLGRSRIKARWLAAGFAVTLVVAFGLAALIGRLEMLASLIGTAGSLRTIGVLHYGAGALVLVTATRAAAVRKPSWLALEVGLIVLSIAVMLAAHRGGFVARPLWLSDFAWRRGVDPQDVVIAFGIAAALVAVSLMMFERKGRLSIAALPLLPLLALLAVSCLEVAGGGDGPSEGAAGESEEDGEDAHPTETDDHDGVGPDGQRDAGRSHDDGDGRDAGRPRPEGGDGGLDGGRSGRGDGGFDGGASGGGDGGLDGGAAGRGDGGAGARGDGGLDGGRGGGGGDAGRDGGVGGGGGADGGGDGGGGLGMGDGGASGGSGGDAGADPLEGWDAGLDDMTGTPPPQVSETENTSGQSSGQTSDLLDTPPPTGESAARPAAIVIFENDYSPPSGTYYFRQNAWTEWDGHRLVPSERLDLDRDVAHRYPAGRLAVEAPPTGGRTRVDTRVALLLADDEPFGLEAPAIFTEDRNPNPQRFRRAYRVSSLSQSVDYRDLIGSTPGNPEWSDEVRAIYLTTHPDPRYAALTEEILASLPPARRADPFARAVAIKLWLDERLTYSTRERHADVDDPTSDFLFGNRIGYCVHFAHAAAMLYRQAGLPARIGVGYATAEANRQGGSALLVRTGDAHAWPEIYFEETGWIILDISAHENLDPPGQPADEDLQRMLGEMAREQPAEPEDEVEEPDEDENPITAEMLGYSALALFGIALLAILIGLYLYKLWRRIAPAFAGRDARARVTYRLMLDRLAEVGMSREYGETREEFAERVGALSPSFAPATAHILHVAFGVPKAAPADGLAPLSAKVRQEIGAAIPWWRRALGVLHPLSFLDSR